MENKKIIFFGPWVGEFGFEMQSWISQCEYMRALYPDYFAVASSYWGRRALYKFCDLYLPHSLKSNYANTGACMERAGGGEPIILHEVVGRYIKDSDIQAIPGVTVLDGFNSPMGVEFSCEGLKKVHDLLPHTRLKAEQKSIDMARLMTRGKKVVSITCRDYDRECTWDETRWIEFVDKLIMKDYFVVSILSHMPFKYSFLRTFKRDNFLDLGLFFKDSLDFCENQIAFLNISECVVMANGGGNVWGWKTGTPFVQCYAKRWKELSWSNGAYYVSKLFAGLYGCKCELPIGDPTVMEVSADECIAAVERLITK